MHLIVGLGNPGRSYAGNRHNVGFMLVDRLAAQAGKKFRRVRDSSLNCSVERMGRRVILAKPQTYMNLSGEAVRDLLEHHSLEPSHLLVIYDDLALPLGVLRIRASGSAGGQKGMKSIIDTLGTQKVPRLRIGISSGQPPDDHTEYVLSDFTQNEVEILEQVFDRAVQAIDTILGEGLERAMAQYNAAVSCEP